MSTDTTITLMSLALDATVMRQTAIAHNVANSNSVNAQTISVNFEEQLPQQITNESLSSIHPFYELSPDSLSLDQHMALNIANMTHYRALIKGLNEKFALMKLALQGTNT